MSNIANDLEVLNKKLSAEESANQQDLYFAQHLISEAIAVLRKVKPHSQPSKELSLLRRQLAGSTAFLKFAR